MTDAIPTFHLGPIDAVGGVQPAASAANPAADLEGADVIYSDLPFIQEDAGALAAPAPAAQAQVPAGVPECDFGSCFVIHSEGPGVTTLAIGEEDNAGGYIALPVIDGVAFMEPPVEDFGAVTHYAEYEVSTLAIGEEEGGIAVADAGAVFESHDGQAAAIVSNAPAYAPYEPAPTQVAFERPVYRTVEPVPAIGQEPVFEAPPVYAYAQPVPQPDPRYGTMAPVTGTVAYDPAPIVETVSVAEVAAPRAKPAGLEMAGVPLPEAKPGVGGIPIVPASISTVEPTGVSAAAQGDYVSVGSYDDYLRSLGEESTAPAPVSAVGEPLPATESVSLEPVTSVAPAAVSTAEPVAPLASPEPSGRVERTYIPAREAALPADPAPAAVNVVDPSAADAARETSLPRVKPAQEDASLTAPSIAPAAPAGLGAPATGDSTTLLPADTAGETATASEIEARAPREDGRPIADPPAGNLDAPRLTEEDFRITTLALGEEEAGGG